jgi:hypothetical protein
VPIHDTGEVRVRKQLDRLDDRYLWWRADRANRLGEFIERLFRRVRRLAGRG